MLSKKQSYGIGKPPDATTHKRGTITHIDRFGTNIAITPKRAPPVSDYDDWLKSRNRKTYTPHHARIWTGAKIRRCVIMRRQGSTWNECAEAVGLARTSGSTVKYLLEFLPLELQV